MLIFFLADLPMRETSVYLIPCVLAVGWAERRRFEAIGLSAFMAAAWLAVHLVIARRFRANPSDVGLHFKYFSLVFNHPRYWPQILTAFGYLWLPLLLAWRFLSKKQLCFLLAALPGIAVSAVFGIWYETRVWAEWNTVAAVLVFSAIVKFLGRRTTVAAGSLCGYGFSEDGRDGSRLQTRL